MNLSPGKLPSQMKHSFSQVPKADIPRSSFNRSHSYKTTFNAGDLIPFFIDEALPGDTMNLRATIFARVATPIVPVMDNLHCSTFFFAVPYRLVWDNFKKFMGEQTNPGDSTSYLIPQMVSPVGGPAVGSLSDYFGIPTVGQIGGAATITFNSLWHRAYQLCYNEWFRDENLQNSVTVDKGDGPDTYANYAIRKRGKRHDYFTSCLPWPQKGTAVTIPLGTSAPILGIGTFNQNFPVAGGTYYESSGATAVYPNARIITGASDDTRIYVKGTAAASGFPAITADLTNATAATINSLRQAFQLQKLYERDARGGTRYTEIVKSHFGVTSPDSRQQRSEYLGGGSTPVSFTPIPQTSSTDAVTPQGNLAAMATISVGGNGFVKSFTEHTLLLGLVCVNADLSYQQGLNRMFSRRTRFDHYWPALSHIGEQAVLNKEIYADGSANDALVFGYQEAFAEYRYKPSLVTGVFRSTAASTLDIWHLAQKFTSLPTLGATFISEDPPLARITATTTQPDLLFDAYFDYKCVRPMPVYSVPGLIDHF